MKVKEGLVVRKMNDSYVAVAVGDLVNEFNGLVRLNETAYFVFNLLKEEQTKEDLIEALTKEYNVDSERISNDLDKMLNIFRENELLDE